MALDNVSFKVAAVQAMPVFLNRSATIEKACELIAAAGQEGARLVVFPEAFIPAYPDWVWAVPSGEEGILSELYAELLANSVAIPSDATEQLFIALGASDKNLSRQAAAALLCLRPIVFIGQEMLEGRE